MKKIFLSLLFIFLLISAGVAQVSAQTINGCVNNKTGILRIASPCTKTETPISWNQTSSAGTEAVQVYDSNNQYIGILISGPPSYPMVFLPTIGKFMTFRDDYYFSGGASPSARTIFFKSADCTGTPYFNFGGKPLFPQVIYREILNDNPYQENIWQAAGEPEDGIFNSMRDVPFGQTDMTSPPGYFFPAVCMTSASGMSFPVSLKATPLTPAVLPFSLPVAFPLKFK